MQIENKFCHDSITIHFGNGDSEYKLTYRIYNHPPARKWLDLMVKTLAQKSKIIDDGIFFGSALVSAEMTAQQINDNLIFHNQYCKKNNFIECLIHEKLDNPATQERLSALHNYFEKYAHDERFSEPQALKNLQNLNLNIHRMESTLSSIEASHIEILFHDLLKVDLADEDYTFFSPDVKWGEMYLTYGMTGVPTINAFQTNSSPRPQNIISNGTMLGFWSDRVFNRMSELKIFLEKNGMDINDPKSALGYIPLGMIENLSKLDKKEIVNNLKTHTFIKKITINSEKDKDETIQDEEATWPYDPEVLYHLDLIPYIDLDINFDAKKLYQEAQRALGYFVKHRDYDQEAKNTSGLWKSLALRGLFGDYSKTQYHDSYSFEGKPVYKNTAFAELCPETMMFLNTITDISRCERIRYMLLEPGASIKTHRDSQDRDVCTAVNISLNMPDECIFYSNLNKDGTENRFTVKLPFKDSGSVILFNNAKYHKVVNNSSKPRIHIIVHGPIKFSDEKLLRLAKKQNKINDYQELVRRVLFKKNFLGEELTKTPLLYKDWVITGLRDNSIPDNYSVAIYDHDKYHETEKGSRHYLELRTIPTFFPLKYELIRENEWDVFLKRSFDSGQEFAVIVASGTFFLNLHSFIKNLMLNSQELKSKGWVAAGHIMDFNDGKQLPYFHEQFLIINLRVWNELGQTKLGPLFSGKTATISKLEVSSEMIHDNYTPLFIKAADTRNDVSRSGTLNWGSELIKNAVANGKGVLNLSLGLREEKKYAYPRDDLKQPKKEIEDLVTHRLNHSGKEVFYFNNEPLTVPEVPGLIPNKIISVAAGLKAFQVINQYNCDKNLKVNFVDFSDNALEYIRQLVKVTSYNSLQDLISNFIKRDEFKSGTVDKVEAQLNGIVRTYFNGDSNSLIESIRMARHSEFYQDNFLTNEHALSSLLMPEDKFVIWISNSFFNNALFLLMTPVEAEKKLFKVITSIAQKMNLKVFAHPQNHTFLFGREITSIQGMVSAGVDTEIPTETCLWKEVSSKF